MIDDSDDKRRRNLVSYSVAVCLVATLGIDIPQFLSATMKIAIDAPPWRLPLVGISALAYLTWRFAVRTREPKEDSDSDWRLARTLYERQLQSAISRFASSKYAGQTFKAAEDGSLQIVLSEPLKSAYDSVMRLPRTAHGTPTSVSIDSTGSKGAATVRSTVIVLCPVAHYADGTKQPAPDAEILIHKVHPIVHLFSITAWAKTLLLSKQTVDVFLPYGFAVAAGVTLVFKLAAAIGF